MGDLQNKLSKLFDTKKFILEKAKYGSIDTELIKYLIQENIYTFFK